MNNIISELASPVDLISLTPNSKVVMQFKLARGNEMIDLRTWSRWSDNEFHAGRNGIFIQKDVLEGILDRIKEELASH